MSAPLPRRLFAEFLGNVSSTYTVVPAGSGSRLILKLVAIPPRGGPLGAAYRRVMPWFDLLMMRKQFLTLKRLAEETAALPLDPTGAR